MLISLSQTTSAQLVSLTEAYTLALENDPEIAIAKESAKIGAELKTSARAALFPQLEAFATYRDSTNESNGEFPITLDQDQNPLTAEIRALRPVNSETDEISQTWGARLTQVLFDPAAWFNYKQGKFQSRQAELQFTLEQTNLIHRLVESYFQGIRSYQMLKVAKSLEAADSNLLELSKKLKRAGVTGSVDVFQAQAAVDASHALRLEAQSTHQEALAALSYSTGTVVEDLWSLPEVDLSNVYALDNLQQWLDAAKKNNLEVRIADISRQAAKAAYKSALSEHSLKINADIQYSQGSSDTYEIDNSLPYDFNSETDGFSVSVNATLPLFTGGRTSSNRRRAHHEYLRANAQYAAIVRGVQRQVLSTLHDLAASQQQIASKRKAVDSSQKALSAVLRSFQVGAIELAEVLNTRKALYEVQRSLIESRINYVLTLTRLELLSGTLSPHDIAELNDVLVVPPEEKESSLLPLP